jgi:hypothetical protein
MLFCLFGNILIFFFFMQGFPVTNRIIGEMQQSISILPNMKGAFL